MPEPCLGTRQEKCLCAWCLGKNHQNFTKNKVSAGLGVKISFACEKYGQINLLKKIVKKCFFAMPSMLWEQKLNYLVHEYFEASGHFQTRPMQPETTCPDMSHATKDYMSRHVLCSKGLIIFYVLIHLKAWIYAFKKILTTNIRYQKDPHQHTL